MAARSYSSMNFRTSLLVSILGINASSVWADPSVALGYTPKYKPGFAHFDYVNADAPDSDQLILSAFGNFDSLNPYTLKSISADGLGLLVFESLMIQSLDEPYSLYAHLAEDVQLAKDKLSVVFRLNPKARFSDGSPVTAEDVKFSYDTLVSDQAHPQYRFYWADIKSAKVLDRMTVRFDFVKVNPELHMLAASIPVFSRNWLKGKKLNEVSTELPIGSGPYVVEKYDLSKSITYKRNPNYWARDLNTRKGMLNFKRITYKYYKDNMVRLEGFKAGEFNFIWEFNSKQWARDYTGPQFEQKKILRQEVKHSNNAGMQGFAFNLRRDKFKDVRVRRAITLAFDFAWSNQKLFYGQYRRCDSYFSNSELAARGIPQGAELALLEKHRKSLPPELFTQEWRPPVTDQSGDLRKNLRQAKALLEEAGWKYRDGALRNNKGEPLEFEFLLAQKGFERILAPFARNLQKLGIQMNYRTVDVALYQRRQDTFDFDMLVTSFGQSQSPGNELINLWHSSTAEQEGAGNVFGLKNPVIDELIHQVIYAPDRKRLVTAVRALDRVMLWGEYLVPNWYIDSHRVAYWDMFESPKSLPLYFNADSWVIQTWWKK